MRALRRPDPPSPKRLPHRPPIWEDGRCARCREAHEMRAWIAGLAAAALAAGVASAKPPRDLEVNVTYCINQNLEARGSEPQRETVGRLRANCERLVESLD